jgi:hypothetical protein
MVPKNAAAAARTGCLRPVESFMEGIPLVFRGCRIGAAMSDNGVDDSNYWLYLV